MTLRTFQRLVAELGAQGTSPCVIGLRPGNIDERSCQRLASGAARLAAGLSQRGIGRGDPVGICAENSPEWIVTSLGVLTAGGTVVPIDAQFGDEALAHVLHDRGAKLLFASRNVADRLKHLKIMPGSKQIMLSAAGLEGLMSDEPARFPYVETSDVAVLFYTSGATGKNFRAARHLGDADNPKARFGTNTPGRPETGGDHHSQCHLADAARYEDCAPAPCRFQ